MLHKIMLIPLALYAGLTWSAVDVNQADVAALDGIRGIGPGMSRKILLERGQGRFTSWEDLMARVPGVKGKSAAKFSAQGLTVDGQSYTEASKALPQ
ncbi:hypothetical protein os1_07020 [Comamonadaceae bacterium OS-1]|nr:hypothetical protein os1_07020 [Comamonadaceae bacterium OS-1]